MTHQPGALPETASRNVLAAGLETRVLLAGPEDAPAVLLLHGGVDRAASAWAETIPALSPRYRVVAPDLPGYGATAGFDRPHRIADLGRWALALLDRLGIDRVDVVGNSLGGGTAIWLALEAKERVRRLVPVGSYGLARRAPLLHEGLWLQSRAGGSRLVARLALVSDAVARAELAVVFADPRRITPDMVRGFREEARRQAQHPAFADFLGGELHWRRFRTCFLDRLHEIAAPTLFVHGTRDRLVPLRHAREALTHMPGARLEVIEAGHWPMRERPDAFCRALSGFLATE